MGVIFSYWSSVLVTEAVELTYKSACLYKADSQKDTNDIDNKGKPLGILMVCVTVKVMQMNWGQGDVWLSP